MVLYYQPVSNLDSKTRAESIFLHRSDCHIYYTVFRGGSDGVNRNRRNRPVLGLGFQAADENTPGAGAISDRIELNFCTSGIIDVECRMLRLENALLPLQKSAEAALFFKILVSAPCTTSPLPFLASPDTVQHAPSRARTTRSIAPRPCSTNPISRASDPLQRVF